MKKHQQKMVENKLTFLGCTPRLLLRAPQLDDVETLVRLWLDPEVTRWMGGPRQRKVVEESFLEYAADPAVIAARDQEWWWVIVELDSGRIAGLTDLQEKEIEGIVEMEVGYYLLPDFWGKGYAAEAARLAAGFAYAELGRSSLVAIIDPHNTASAAVAERLGMTFEKAVLRLDGVIRHIYRVTLPV